MSRRDTDERQLDLFASPAQAAVVPSLRTREMAELAARLPSGLRLGTSSWSFPGWAGLVYERERRESDLARDGLREYVRCPLFGCVGIDRGYYGPIPQADLGRYAEQLPPAFPCVIKVWESLTTRVFPRHPRWGERAGRANPDYLDVAQYVDLVLGPCQRVFADHVASLVLEFPSSAPGDAQDPRLFADELDAFLARVPRGLRHAVEIRDRRLLTPDYLAVLRAHDVSHVVSYWSWMPTPAEQLRVEGILTASFVVSRLVLRPGTRYEERKAAMAPFDRIRDPDPDMREAVVQLWLRARAQGKPVFVTINNKAEGSAPLSVAAIARDVVRVGSWV